MSEIVMGQRLHSLRRLKNLSLEALAKKVPTSKSYIWELENNKELAPSAGKMLAIASALDVTVDFLLTGYNDNLSSQDEIILMKTYRELPKALKKIVFDMAKSLNQTTYESEEHEIKE